ncbi:hypothetical protein POM88_020196 [Heracleum sosnowskyi]|uniref:CCHC-type domain-containing protein n=1 Tax=Heracleum sosnowskyi TaxID=360622 RepID=A0AAD8IBF9_9APIA|nr:hypothetical protein POM88_020196 [Heracleum sosnowskyi]
MLGIYAWLSENPHFGVALLGIITCKKANDNSEAGGEHNLVNWVDPVLQDCRKFSQMADPVLQGQYSVRGSYQALDLTAIFQEGPTLHPLISEVAGVTKLDSIPDLQERLLSTQRLAYNMNGNEDQENNNNNQNMNANANQEDNDNNPQPPPLENPLQQLLHLVLWLRCSRTGHMARDCPRKEDTNRKTRSTSGMAGPPHRATARTFNMTVKDAIASDEVVKAKHGYDDVKGKTKV